MTLSTYRKDFRELLAAVKDKPIEVVGSEWPDAAVDDKLNRGWQKASDEVRGFKQVIIDGITSGTQRYGLASNVISVLKVEMFKDSKLYTTPEIVDNTDIETYDTTTYPAGIPNWCSVVTHLYGDNSTGLELYFFPAPNWTEASALYVYALVRFGTVSSITGAAEVSIPPELGQAGLYWALYLASGLNDKFANLYKEAIKTWYKSGVDNAAYQKGCPWLANVSRNVNAANLSS